MNEIEDMASSTSEASRKTPSNMSTSAYAMSTTVETSAEFLLAVSSSNSEGGKNTYYRSISSPCGSSSSSLPSPSKKQQQQHSNNDENESPTSTTTNSISLHPSSPTPSRRSYPGALSPSSTSSDNYTHGDNVTYQDSHEYQPPDEEQYYNTSSHPQEQNNTGSSSSNNNNNNNNTTTDGDADADGGDGSGGHSISDSQRDECNEGDDFCEDAVSISEDRSLTESIPDSFHTPSTSIQNLTINVSNSNKYKNNKSSSSSSHHHHHHHSDSNASNNTITSTSHLRSSGRSTSSNKSESDSNFSSSSSGGGYNNNNNNNNGSVGHSSSTTSDNNNQATSSSNSNTNNNFSNNGLSHSNTNGSSSKTETTAATTTNSASSSSSGSGSERDKDKDKDKDKKLSPNLGKNSHDSKSQKGSPETPHAVRHILDQTSGLTVSNLTSSSELTGSVESNVSKDSSGSSGKETVVVSPHYGPKPNKKKMWYHVFYPSYKTRSGDFKKIFKELPLEERLIVDYSCALQKEILIQGRMYVSQNYISFYANIFGWETQTSIRLKDVTSITKEKTALVIPNAVQVSTEQERFFFTSFVTRDATYVMLFKLWQSSLLEDVSRNTLPTKEIWKLVHSCYGEELGVASEEDPEDFLACATGALVKASSITTLMSSDVDDGKSISEDSQVCASELGGEHLTVPLGAVLHVGESISDGLLTVSDSNVAISGPTTDLSDTSDSEGEADHGPSLVVDILDVPLCPVSHQTGREVVNSIIPTDVDSLFTMLFTNSKFFLDLHTARKTFDIVQSQWQQSPDGSHKIRQVSFTVTLNHVMGPKHSQVTESQVMLPVSKPGRMYAIDVESVNAGIPYADSFYVTTHFCLSRISPNETKLCIVNQIKYKKSVWKYTKGFIEKNTWAGLEEFYTYLERALKEECGKINSSRESPSVSPRGPGSCLNVRRRHPKKKAPDVPVGITPPLPPSTIRDIIRNGSIPSANLPISQLQLLDSATTSTSGSQTTAESPIVLKIILGVLACLLLLNAFLYVKLARFESSSKSHLLFQSQPIAFPKNVPRNHKEWISLLQQQEDLHRLELQKWHEILISALKILHQAEEDLESLKFHITAYSNGKFSISTLKEAVEKLQGKSSDTNAYNIAKETLANLQGGRGDRREDLIDGHSMEDEHLASTNNRKDSHSAYNTHQNNNNNNDANENNNLDNSAGSVLDKDIERTSKSNSNEL